MAVAARENRGWPGWSKFGLILAAMVCARTCAMAFNRIVDRKFDALNPRTADRHLPSGQVSLTGAILLCLTSGAGLVTASYFLNPLCFYLSPVALVVICFYSLTKRFTDLHAFLSRFGPGPGAGGRMAGGEGDAGLFLEICQMLVLATCGGAVAGGLRHHLCAAGLRVRPDPWAAFAGGGVGAQERSAGGVSGACAPVRVAAWLSGCCAVSGSPISSVGC